MFASNNLYQQRCFVKQSLVLLSVILRRSVMRFTALKFQYCD
ncbi:hypothetical protein GPLA_0835 [Paraglaciecola polaris LMG 21857]|uniref:Uncharacterized protein n=1 Tax=Paraglaciecola polaris LMG 21857 TaxID=1129793 RepID=K6Z6C6_9ALTE|nr:hypothetical protein GPLA_0835 [Paraglaciecola polaris LMG 21857]